MEYCSFDFEYLTFDAENFTDVLLCVAECYRALLKIIQSIFDFIFELIRSWRKVLRSGYQSSFVFQDYVLKVTEQNDIVCFRN